MSSLESSRLQLGLVVFALIVYFLYSLVQHQNKRREIQALPVADVISGDWRDAILRASSKYPDSPWILPTSPPRVILPNSVMDEVRFLPENQVSLRKEVYKKMHGRYTDLGTDHPVGISAIKTDLTNNVGRMLPALQDETVYALDREFGHIGHEQWTKIGLYENLLQLSALVNGRMFVGLPLCRNQAWIDLTIKYTLDMVYGIQAVEKVHPMLRRLKAPFLQEIRNLATYKKRAAVMLRPHIDELVEARKASGGKGDKENVKFNLISWMLNQMQAPDYELLASEQIFAAFGAIHATCIAVTNALYDLAAHPQYVAELRVEMGEILAMESDHILRKVALPKLIRLDSFLRESQRMNPGSITSIHRIVTARNGLKLSTGHTIPQNTSIGFLHPLAPFVHPAPNLTLPTDRIPSQPPLSEFYPFRHAEVRALPGQMNHHQFAMTAQDNINFGHGPSSCPGRFFAGAEVKVIVCEILRRYDVALGPNGEGDGEGGFVRPANIVQTRSLQCLPDFTKTIYLRALPQVLPEAKKAKL